MINLITAGHSHGDALIGIIEGLPKGVPITEEYINEFLKKRQMGYGRGKRMKMEHDKVKIISGVWKGETTGTPISLLIKNRGARPQDKEPPRTIPRPGHADFAGAIKYEYINDFNPVIERSSARETAMRVALTAITRRFLEEIGIEVLGYVKGIGKIDAPSLTLDPDSLKERRDASPLFMLDEETEKKCISLIDDAKKQGYTLGGRVEVIAFQVPPGLGSFATYKKRLDARLSYVLMSLPTVKAVEIGDGIESSYLPGNEAMDPFVLKEGRPVRTTNHSGGIEGGISNGEPIRVAIYSKPIPTQPKPLSSFDFSKIEATQAPYIRSDLVIIPALSVIAELLVSYVIADAFLERFGGDTLSMIKKHYDLWREEWKEVLSL